MGLLPQHAAGMCMRCSITLWSSWAATSDDVSLPFSYDRSMASATCDLVTRVVSNRCAEAVGVR